MKNKVALITGASGGIGIAISQELSRRGYRLSLLSRRIPPQESNYTLAQQCDITRVDAVNRAVSNTIAKFGRIDVVVNCAGRSHLGTVDEVTPQDIETVYDVNVRGTVNVSKAVLPFMKERGAGYIINIGSLRGVYYGVGKSAYAMSKSAVIAFSRILAMEVQDCGIKVTVINPGFVQTSLIRHRIVEENLKSTDLTQPNDIAKTVMYLLNLSPGACVKELSIGRLWGLE
jgi:NADP-dependent 3-hydroxy acid dehydrogenase YdfG